MFSIFKKKPGGLIEYYKLSDWWLTTFTDNERQEIISTFGPLGNSEDSLTEGSISFANGSATGLLSALAGWFKNEKSRNIAYKILEKAEELDSKATVLERHFLYQAKIETYYRFRDIDSFALSRAIEACEQQISMSAKTVEAFKKEYKDAILPAHVGYKQLAIIRDKEGNFNEAIKVCEKALKQGWGGDWEKRIVKYEKKLK